jgi:hypothetical protein
LPEDLEKLRAAANLEHLPPEQRVESIVENVQLAEGELAFSWP